MNFHHGKVSVRTVALGAGTALALTFGGVADVFAETPASALKLAKTYNMPSELMAKWEAEHKVPAAWIAGAKKEGKIRINDSSRPQDFDKFAAPFRERYPFIKIVYSRGSRSTRVIKPLVAFREGRLITDIVAGINTRLSLFTKANALTDLTNLPNRANIPVNLGGTAKQWIGARLRYYCLAYNTKMVKKSELPKTWEDLKTSTSLQNRKTALWYGVGSWLLPLWGTKGPEWTTQFIKDIYGTLKAERRKEGMTALTSLTGAGEFKAVLSVAAYMVIRLNKKGSPVGFHCPETVMVNASALGLLKGSPNTNAGKLYLNWLLSMEGQLFQYRYTGARPIHKALQNETFMPFPKETLGKTLAFFPPERMDEELPKLMKVWSPYWEGGGGPKGKGRKRGRKRKK